MHDIRNFLSVLSDSFCNMGDSTELVTHFEQTFPAKERYRVHEHTFFEISIVFTAESFSDRSYRQLEKVIISPPHNRHMGMSDDERTRCFSLQIELDEVSFMFNDRFSDYRFFRSELERYGIHTASFLETLSIYCRETHFSRRHLALILAVFFSALSLVPEADSLRRKLRPATRLRDLIHRNYAKPEISIAQMAHSLGYSPNYLVNLFEDEFGIAPRKYLIRYRLEQSQKALLRGLHVKEAAESCGWNSAAYFSSCYRKYFGCSPKEEQKAD